MTNCFIDCLCGEERLQILQKRTDIGKSLAYYNGGKMRTVIDTYVPFYLQGFGVRHWRLVELVTPDTVTAGRSTPWKSNLVVPVIRICVNLRTFSHKQMNHPLLVSYSSSYEWVDPISVNRKSAQSVASTESLVILRFRKLVKQFPSFI